MRVANKYFLADNSRILIVGKGADVVPALEKLKIPILFFDKYGNAVEKPVFKKEVPKGMTAKTVLDNYIKAIGGEKAVLAVKTIAMVGSTTIPQAPAPLSFKYKTDVKGKLFIELTMGAMSALKQVVTEKGGFAIQQGQKMEYTGKDLEDMKAIATPILELNLLKNPAVSLTGIEMFNGTEAYALKNGKTTLYYDVKSGLKIADVDTIEQGGQTMNKTNSYLDYREVKGVKVPFNLVQNIGIELNIKMSEVKINEGVTDADFQ
jgi:hypothetical protein